MPGPLRKRRRVLTAWPWVAEPAGVEHRDQALAVRALQAYALWPTERAGRISLVTIGRRFAAAREAPGLTGLSTTRWTACMRVQVTADGRSRAGAGVTPPRGGQLGRQYRDLDKS
jgi:hypothetical protein